MRRFALDAGPAADWIYNRNGIVERIRTLLAKGGQLGVTTPTVGELLAGAEMSNDPDRHRKIVLREVASIAKWPFEFNAAREFGRIRGALDCVGRKMQQIDIQIAAIAMSMGRTTVITYDSDLSAIPGLSVENWLEPS